VSDVTTPSDRFDLQRFVTAQARGDIYDRALDELRRGRKQSHWMWYVFPQVAGLGTSTMAQRYAISSLAEAEAYVAHPLLGARLVECARMLIDLGSQDPVQVVGAVDSLKLRSSMTLFERAAPSEPVFAEVLEKYFGGRRDQATLDRL
jgi:uncharacterized protein (DUF1810 family)